MSESVGSIYAKGEWDMSGDKTAEGFGQVQAIGVGHGRGCEAEYMPRSPAQEEPIHLRESGRVEAPRCLSARQFLDIFERQGD